MKLILASNSRTRKVLLDNIGVHYDVHPSDIAEKSNETQPENYVMDISRQKAIAVAKQIKNGIIISADSVIYVDNIILGKPKNLENAKEMMRLLSGKVSYAVTGVTIYDLEKDKIVTFNEVTEVHFNSLNEQEIDWYVNNESYILERCGYSMAGKASLFISKICGDYYNILGLPLSRLYSELKKLGYDLYKF